MDPIAAVQLVTDTDTHPLDRCEALDGLRDWTDDGGFLPCLDRAARWLLRTSVAELDARYPQCEGRWTRRLERILDAAPRPTEGLCPNAPEATE